MKKPVIGIIGSTRRVETGLFVGGEQAYTGSTYVNAVLRNGGIPIMIPAAAIRQDEEAALAVCDGLLFPGGEDMTPSYYGEEPLPVIGVFRPENDEAALKAGRYGLAKKIPMLGICKGHQTLNVLCGGSLYQDLSLQPGEKIQHLQKYSRSYLTHHVEVEAGTHLASVLGAGSHMTNSMHHQSVKKLGQGLRIAARACDGTVEAIEDAEGLIIGIQWHPEDLVDTAPEMNRIFADLMDRCQRRKKN